MDAPPIATPTKPRPRHLRSWHRWCGLAVLAFLLIAALSGALLVYKKELVRLLITPGAELPANYDTTHMARQLDRIVQQTEAGTLRLIKAPNSKEPYWTLTVAGRNGESIVRLLSPTTLEPYRDNLWLLDSMAFIRELHTELLTGAVGEALLLACGVGGVFLSVTGLLIWWPTRRSFRWRWVLPRPMPMRFVLHSHRHAGAVAALILIPVILTGSIMLWQKLVRPLLAPAPDTTLPTTLAGEVAPSQWLLAASAAVPDGKPTYIRLPDGSRADASIRFRLPGEWHPNGRTSVTLETTTGKMTLGQRSDEARPARRALNQLYPLHSGYGMGWGYALLIFASGIALLWLGLSGGMSYLRRLPARGGLSFPRKITRETRSR